jgi:Thiol-disulfide isomerase and thioredoxins
LILSRLFLTTCLFAVALVAGAQNNPKQNSPASEGPKDPKAIKTFQAAIEWHKSGMDQAAIGSYRKAFKQDNGQCWACLSQAYSLAMGIGAYKDAQEIAREWLTIAQNDTEKGTIHYGLGASIEQQGLLEKKDKLFADSRDEFQTALALTPSLAAAHYNLGICLAFLHQDNEAVEEFRRFLDQDKKMPTLHARAERYVNRIDLARATMAPPFTVATLDGKQISMDSLAGKVVLIDFWATWCGPCREALPHMRSIAHKFEGQPFVLLSINLDKDATKWRDFVAKNDMTWTQCHQDGFDGNVAKLFNVRAIPSTFSIDADGVMEDQHVGDANIEGKLKKMIARAVELSSKNPTAAQHAGGSGQ